VLIVGGNQSAAGGYNVDNSLRFNEASNDYLNTTFGTSTSTQKCTYSIWVKRSKLQDFGGQYLLVYNNVGDAIYFNGAGTGVGSNDQFVVYSGGNIQLYTNRLFRDISAWYHIVVAVDTTQATASNRVKLYVNGVQETSFAIETYPAQNFNFNTLFSSSSVHEIGRGSATGITEYFAGYMSEIVFIDGQQLDPTSFGEFDEDSGIWKPIDVSGLTFGNNGFYLPFENSAALGQDDSGNGNNFTVNNLTSIDQTTDTPTNNYATMNSLIPFSGGSVTYSNGNLDGSAGAFDMNTSTTIGVNNGKWYWELKWTGNGGFDRPGIVPESYNPNLTAAIEGIAWNRLSTSDGMYMLNVSQSGSWGSAFSTGDIIMFALDCDNKKFYIGQNGTWRNSGDPTSGASGTGAVDYSSTSPLNSEFLFPSMSKGNAGTTTWQFNFGNPAFTISSGNSDGNGYGNFEYSVPSGYYALNTKNLAEYG